MNSNEIETWGRHFDTLVWTVTTIMGAGIGGLLVYSKDNFDTFLALVGFILTVIAVYFASSFRDLKHRCEKYYSKEIKEVLSNWKLSQWGVYILIFILLGLLWIKLLIEKKPELRCLWIIVGTIGIGSMIYFGYKSRGRRVVNDKVV